MADESALASPVARRALLAGGGSGGHVFPALAVGDEVARRGWSVALAGSPAGPSVLATSTRMVAASPGARKRGRPEVITTGSGKTSAHAYTVWCPFAEICSARLIVRTGT